MAHLPEAVAHCDVIVDQEGEVYSLARQLIDVKTKELKKFLKDVHLPDVEHATGIQELKSTIRQALPEGWPQQLIEPPKPPEPKPEQKPQPKPQQPEQQKPEKDPHLEKLEAAMRERHARESRQQAERQRIELERLKEVHKADLEELLEARRSVQKAELDRFYRKEKEHNDDWVKKFFQVMKFKWNPAVAEKHRQERERLIEELRTRHRIERETLIETRKIQRDQDIDDLKARHGQQILEQNKRYNAELQRYQREQEADRKILKDMEEERRKEQLKQKTDEPGPPKRSL